MYTKRFSSRRSGDICEYTIVTEAWKRGAEVYLNAGSSGKTDLVLEVEGKLYQIDSKIADLKRYPSSNRWGWVANHAASVKPPVWALVVEPHDDGYRIRWPLKHGRNQPPLCPPGLEKFWD